MKLLLAQRDDAEPDLTVEFFNFSDYPATCFGHRDAKGDLRDVVVLGLALDIASDGGLTPAVPQPPLNFSEVGFSNEALETESQHSAQKPLRRESDLAPHKPKVDVIVNANAYAPGGRPARSFPAGIRILRSDGAGAPGERIVSSFILVTGPRQWRYRPLASRAVRRLLSMTTTLGLWKPSPWRLGRAAPVTSVPVRYDFAYGGSIRLDDDPKHPAEVPLHVSCPYNPVGRGYVPDITEVRNQSGQNNRFARRWFRRWKRQRTISAPQLQLPGRPLPSDPSRPYPLVGWGTVPKHWLPRLDLAGTFDERWERECHPLLPEDFNDLYWNGAHPSLQLDGLDLDAHIELYRLTPSIDVGQQLLRLRLPGYGFSIEYQDAYMLEPTKTDLTLDTVHIDLMASRVTLLYRTHLDALDESGYIQLNPKERT